MIVVSVDCPQGNGTFQSRCQFFDYSSEIMDVRGAEHWNRLPEEVVESAVLEMFRSCQDTILTAML